MLSTQNTGHIQILFLYGTIKFQLRPVDAFKKQQFSSVDICLDDLNPT